MKVTFKLWLPEQNLRKIELTFPTSCIGEWPMRLVIVRMIMASMTSHVGIFGPQLVELCHYALGFHKMTFPVSSQLLLQHHSCLPAAMLCAMMVMNSDLVNQ